MREAPLVRACDSDRARAPTSQALTPSHQNGASAPRASTRTASRARAARNEDHSLKSISCAAESAGELRRARARDGTRSTYVRSQGSGKEMRSVFVAAYASTEGSSVTITSTPLSRRSRPSTVEADRTARTASESELAAP